MGDKSAELEARRRYQQGLVKRLRNRARKFSEPETVKPLIWMHGDLRSSGWARLLTMECSVEAERIEATLSWQLFYDADPPLIERAEAVVAKADGLLADAVKAKQKYQEAQS